MGDIFLKRRLNKEKKRMQDLIHCLGLSVYSEYKSGCKSDKTSLFKNIEECEIYISKYEEELKNIRLRKND